jgi:4-hydroxy-tetrahydrodipicolinate synthase
MDLSGAYTAIATPFTDDGLDEEGLRENIRFQIAEGMDGLVPVGTTGESPTLTPEEHERVIDITVEEAKKAGKKVIAGAGSNSTAEAIRYSQHAKDIGADAALVIVPYYNKPTQEGLYQHFKTVAEEADIPIVIYNVPSRTSRNIDADTVLRLAEIDNIVAIKEAGCNMDQIAQILKDAPKDFYMLSGEDSWTYPIMAMGGHGVISVASNLVPKMVSEMVHKALDGDLPGARDIHYKLFDLYKAIFVETNPGPVKAALAMMSMPAGKLRLPLVEPSEESKEKIRDVLRELHIP